MYVHSIIIAQISITELLFHRRIVSVNKTKHWTTDIDSDSLRKRSFLSAQRTVEKSSPRWEKTRPCKPTGAHGVSPYDYVINRQTDWPTDRPTNWQTRHFIDILCVSYRGTKLMSDNLYLISSGHALKQFLYKILSLICQRNVKRDSRRLLCYA